MANKCSIEKNKDIRKEASRLASLIEKNSTLKEQHSDVFNVLDNIRKGNVDSTIDYSTMGSMFEENTDNTTSKKAKTETPTDTFFVGEDLTLGEAMQQVLSKYDIDETTGALPFSETHLSGLRDYLLPTLQGFMDSVDMKEIKVEMFENKIKDITTGIYNPSTKDIRIDYRKFNKNASAAEVMLHEIVHRITVETFKKRPDLIRNIRELQKLTATKTDYSMFLPEGVDVKNSTKGQKKLAQKRYDYVFEPTSADPEEFFAYAISNSAVFDAVVRLTEKDMGEIEWLKPYETEGISKSDRKVNRILNAFIKVANIQSNAANGRNKNGAAVFSDIIGSVIKAADTYERANPMETLEKEDPTLFNKVVEYSDTMDLFIGRHLNTLETKLSEFNKSTARDPFNKILEVIKKIGAINSLLELGIIQGLWYQITEESTKPTVSKLYASFRAAKTVEKHVVLKKENVYKIIKDMHEWVYEPVKESIKQIVYDADLKTLLQDNGTFNKKELYALLTDDKKLKEAIANSTSIINSSLNKHMKGSNKDFRIKYMHSQMNGLASYIIKGSSPIKNQMINANNILAEYRVGNNLGLTYLTDKEKNKVIGDKSYVEKLSKNDKKRGEFLSALEKDGTIKEVDKLITLKALTLVPKDSKELLGSFIMSTNSRNINLINDSANFYKKYIDDILKEDSKISNYDPVVKGYTKPEKNSIQYKLIPEKDVAAAWRSGMNFVGSDINRGKVRLLSTINNTVLSGIDPYIVIDGVKYFMMTGTEFEVSFAEGSLGIISNTLEGVSLTNLLTNANYGGNNKEVKSTSQLLFDNTSIIKDYAKLGNASKIDDKGHTLIPVVNNIGDIVDYRIPLDKETSLVELEQDNSLESVLANTYSRAVKTNATKTSNKKVIDDILENFDTYGTVNPNGYTLVQEYTEEMQKSGEKRSKVHDRWDLIPEHTKEYIRTKTGHNGILIPNSLVEQVTGEKDMSIRNWKLGINLQAYPELRERLTALEGYSKELIQNVKRVTALLNGGVITSNMTSNSYVALLHKISPVDYVKSFNKYWKELNDYTALEKNIDYWQVKKDIGTKGAQNEINSLKRQLSRFELLNLLANDGQFSVIADDINVGEEKQGILESKIQKTIDGSNNAEMLNGLKNLLYINDRSAVGKFAIKNITYQDTISRLIILEKLLNEDVKKYNVKDIEELKIKHPEAITEHLNYVDQLFVNYGYVMNRGLSYAEKVFGTLFLRYYFGQAKAIYSMARKIGTKVIGGELLQRASGIDISDPLDTYSRSVLEALSNRMALGDVVGETITPNMLEPFKGVILDSY